MNNDAVVRKISDQISQIGNLANFRDFMNTVLETDLYWHILCGLEEPAEETKIKLAYLSKAFWGTFLKQNPTPEQVDQTAREVLCSVIDLNQVARVSPVLYGRFASWMIKDMTSQVRPVFENYPEARGVYDSLVLMMQHELDTPLGVLANEGKEQ